MNINDGSETLSPFTLALAFAMICELYLMVCLDMITLCLKKNLCVINSRVDCEEHLLASVQYDYTSGDSVFIVCKCMRRACMGYLVGRLLVA